MTQLTWCRRLGASLLAVVTFGLILLAAEPAQAHGFTTVVYVDATAPRADHVRTTLGLEYDLLLVSVADTQKDDAFYREGQPAWDDANYAAMASALDDHAASVLAYVGQRLHLSAGGHPCTPALERVGRVADNPEQGVPYASLTLDWSCAHDADAQVLRRGHVLRAALFADAEGYVRNAKTIVTYHLDGRSGTAALDATTPAFSTKQSSARRFWEFYRLGIEHLLTGPDHLLFLTALIVGSRKLREVVLAATTFTLAHSTTLLLAAFGLVHVPARVVEPLIALSIAATAGWFLWRVWRRGAHATDLDTASSSHFALDRAGWSRLVVVFAFGLVHGLGFAGALGIDHAWSWALLWSLVVFNIGIETVQIALIIAVFPALMLLRRWAPRTALVLSASVAVAVSCAGLVWFGQRLLAS